MVKIEEILCNNWFIVDKMFGELLFIFHVIIPSYFTFNIQFFILLCLLDMLSDLKKKGKLYLLDDEKFNESMFNGVSLEPFFPVAGSGNRILEIMRATYTPFISLFTSSPFNFYSTKAGKTTKKEKRRKIPHQFSLIAKYLRK